jgi:hypothetical protein
VSFLAERYFRFIQVEDTYVVWLAGPNRFLQLKEPAFFVFNQWGSGIDRNAISNECALRYDLPQEEACRFVAEILDEIEQLFSSRNEGKNQADNSASKHLAFPPPFSTRNYTIFGKILCLTYGDEELEELFHSQFSQYETATQGSEFPVTLIVHFQDGHYYFNLNGGNFHQFPEKDYEQFVGAIFMQILQTMHGKELSEWMAVIHASGVTNGMDTIIFTGSPGSGKSTLAALMMAHGYPVISDDFVPVALNSPEVFPFPAAISAKKGSWPLLKHHFPMVEGMGKTNSPDEEDPVELFIPFPGNSRDSAPSRAKAIVFVKYDPSVECSISIESNLASMNDFLKQTWIASNPDAVTRFMEWYFNLPVFSLVYSDSEKAVLAMKDLLESDGYSPGGENN